MEFIKTKLEGVIKINPSPFEDHRGCFMRTFDQRVFSEHGIKGPWVQDNHSKSLVKNTLRGLHFILPPYTDGKLIRCTKGKIFDVVDDLRKDSSMQGYYETFILDEQNKQMLYIPKGFAHGFITLSSDCEIIYKHDTYYNKEYDSGIVWNDITLGIEWPTNDPVISEKDSKLMTYNKFISKYQGL